MSLMVLGTASHVGKSTVVAAICRAISNRGISVAPFKSQNMSLNSYVTSDGCEIGIAQAMQAFAARLEPEADMNPILLKPKGERISQVVLLGHPYKDVEITDYYKETDFLLERALEALGRLKERYDHLVVEGAGGAAEVNLYSRDIANIRLARALKYPIILVADIERGGVFAQIYGTIQLLPPDLRPLVRGILINKFRGDPAIFAEGIEIIQDMCRIPVLGVLPYLSTRIPSEDSLSIEDKKAAVHPVRIAIIRLDRISNFTDFERLEPHAMVEYVRPGSPLDDFDCIILPGTKNTVDDLALIHGSGTGMDIISARGRGIPIIGICGGYQILGKEIVDSGVESRKGSHSGLSLLDVRTRFGSYEKKTEQMCRTARPIGPILSGMGTLRGYEIHMGETERVGAIEAFDGEGAVSEDGLVIGTYMHGLFENQSAVDALLSYLYGKKGLLYRPDPERDTDPYDKLAAEFEDSADVDEIVSLLLDR
ncbi:MAG: cobalamin biosynthesis protein CobQ [Methanolinea sp. SDB]|nr:MAG: cobalamin biosynthesis protein CobQ [Methanolinea sp. SDB]